MSTPTPAHARATECVDGLRAELVGLSHEVHALAETGFVEHRSVRAIADLLAAHGFESQVGCYGMDTALRAQAGNGNGPRVGVFAEYDALPGIGHGCGHNVICAAGVGAFLGLTAAVPLTGGSVVLFGTPAEENGSGKELMARADAFDDLDVALMLHPTGGCSVAAATSVGLRSVEVSFHGRAAHASSAPHAGRNALDAIVFAYQGVAALRQHIRDDERIHGIIQEGGQAANVVPELARGRFLLRSPDLDGLVQLTHRVQKVLEGAALMTETRLEAQWDRIAPNLPIRPNLPLAKRFGEHLAARGHEVGGGERPHGSTDLGNVSLRLPAIHPYVSIAPTSVAAHTVEFAECAASPEGDRAAIDGAAALALTGVDYLTDPALRAAVAHDFEAAGGAVDVEALMRPPN